jgi:hypothetical protein
MLAEFLGVLTTVGSDVYDELDVVRRKQRGAALREGPVAADVEPSLPTRAFERCASPISRSATQLPPR